MAKRIDIKKIQKKIKRALRDASARFEEVRKETRGLLKRGEGEIAKMSRLGKAQFGILALSVKKEQLYRNIGKKVWNLSTKGKLTGARLKAFCEELSDINREVKNKRKVINKTLRSKESGKRY